MIFPKKRNIPITRSNLVNFRVGSLFIADRAQRINVISLKTQILEKKIKPTIVTRIGSHVNIIAI